MSGSEEMAVSLNGCDNVGKTTQLRWLGAAMPGAHLVGTIDRWDQRWAAVAAGDFSRWWFADSTTEEHVALVFDSHAARRYGSALVALEDRGYPMLVAVCAATAAVKEGLSGRQALVRVESLLASREIPSRRSVHVLLRHSDDPSREAALALQRDPRKASAVYASYQHALAAILELQVANNAYDAVVVRGDRAILNIQRDIRQVVAGHGCVVDPLPDAAPERVWVLGGLSESGKSTVGELLRDEHGVTRLKIGYLLGVAAARAGVTDPYQQWSEQEEAERLAEELLRFTAATKAPRVSLESVHRYEATIHLRRVLGIRCEIVYVDADLPTRADRTTEPLTELSQRDAVKVGRGADRLMTQADWLMRNTRSLAALKLAVARLAARGDHAAPLLALSEPTPQVGRWLHEAVEALVDDEVAAVVATGSTSGIGWLDGWSDIDLLVIRDAMPVGWLRQASARLNAPAEVYVGLSCFTTSEIDARMVPPRVVYALRRLHRQRRGLLYCRAGYHLPLPPLPVGDRANRGDLGLVVMVLRRLVGADEMDVRAVYKHVLLVMKILLQASWVEADTHTEVCTAFARMFPEVAIDLPSPEQILATGGQRSPASARLAAAASRMLDYLPRLSRALQPGTERP